MTKAQKAARKAVVTRQARNIFRDKYGFDGYEVISLIISGKTTDEISDITWIPKTSIAAYRANLTRGAYGKLVNTCNF